MSKFITMEMFLESDTNLVETGEWEWLRKGALLPIRSVDPSVNYAARKSAAKIAVRGKGKNAERSVDFDDLLYKSKIIVAAIDTDRTTFRFDSPEMLQRFNKVAAHEVVPCVLWPNEIDALFEEISKISHFTDDAEAEQDVKN